MRLVLSWLREVCPTDLAPEELGARLSSKGAHLEGIERPWSGLEAVIAARVLDVRDHPRSDRLCLARVQTGSGEQEVVVGVRNMRAGDIVPLAGPGARVPALPEPLSAREIRGVVSNGMLCSAQELAISQDHGGILILNEAKLEPGTDLKAALGLDDAVLDLEIESNRPDLLSVVGLAREVAAFTGLPMTRPDVKLLESDDPVDEAATVEVQAPDGCPRYLARVIRGVSPGPAPLRVQARLSAAGVRPISAVVDATNYVMLETGQPLHGFDLDRLAGPGIVVRRSRPGERLRTLDEVERELLEDDLLICDLERPVGIAGVMGGLTSEIGEATTDVLLESAYFEPRSILRTSRRHLLPTEAALRFSRGTDPEGVSDAASFAARLMCTWAGGRVLRGAIDVGAPPARRRIVVRPARASLLAGHAISHDEVVRALTSLELPAIASSTVDEVDVEIPGFRPDLEVEADLIEEVVRSQGYDRVGSTLPPIRQPGGFVPSYLLRRRVRERLVRAGLREAISLSFASESDVAMMGHADAIRIANPPSADMPFLRTSLIPGLVRALARNADRGIRGAALFEVGHVFRIGEPVRERESVAGVLWGRASQGMHVDQHELDVFDASGAAKALVEGLGIRSARLEEPASAPFHAGRSARIFIDDHVVGVVGELHPRVGEEAGLTARVAAFELDVDALGSLAGPRTPFRDVPRFPPVRRDLAFLVPEGVPAGAVLAALEDAAGSLLDRRVLFDEHRGAPLPEGSKSLAFAIELRAPDRTLTDEDAAKVVDAVVARIRDRFDGELRAG